MHFSSWKSWNFGDEAHFFDDHVFRWSYVFTGWGERNHFGKLFSALGKSLSIHLNEVLLLRIFHHNLLSIWRHIVISLLAPISVAVVFRLTLASVALKWLIWPGSLNTLASFKVSWFYWISFLQNWAPLLLYFQIFHFRHQMLPILLNIKMLYRIEIRLTFLGQFIIYHRWLKTILFVIVFRILDDTWWIYCVGIMAKSHVRLWIEDFLFHVNALGVTEIGVSEFCSRLTWHTFLCILCIYELLSIVMTTLGLFSCLHLLPLWSNKLLNFCGLYLSRLT